MSAKSNSFFLTIIKNVLLKNHRLRAFMLIEIILTLITLLIISPHLYQFTSHMYGRLHDVISNKQTNVELLDLHHALLRDTKQMVGYDSDCCFRTDAHHICYDINRNHIRRRKKRLSSSRFYSHYIGGKTSINSMNCHFTPPFFTFSFSLSETQINWLFRGP